MRYYKMISNGYILSVGIGMGGEEITETEYNNILNIIHNSHTAPEGYGYRLDDSLEWELYEMTTVEPVEELSEVEEKAKAYDILMGVAE